MAAALALPLAKVESVPQISNKSKIYILWRCGSSCALEIQQTSEISGKNVVYLAGKRQGEDFDADWKDRLVECFGPRQVFSS